VPTPVSASSRRPAESDFLSTFAAAKYIRTNSSRFVITVDTSSPLVIPAANNAFANRFTCAFSSANVYSESETLSDGKVGL
jgi:hypothetical protein